MKKNIIKIGLLSALFFTGVYSQSKTSSYTHISSSAQEDLKTEKFKVYGNCGMCKKRIEKAALSVNGVKSANWDIESKIITVQYNDHLLSKQGKSMDNVYMKISKSGHDTQYYKAKDEAYNALPGCCQYERAENSLQDDSHNHNH
ncbi:MAG: ATPase [Fluviicola sp.]|nr:MAG: ATPase [Fluviicola sp.]